MTPLGLSTYQWNNNIKSAMLLAAFPCLLIGLVALFFYCVAATNLSAQGYVPPALASDFGVVMTGRALTLTAFTREATLSVMPIVLAIAGTWLVIGGLFNESLIRMATGAKALTRSEAPEIYNLLENLCISRGMTMPKLYMIDTLALNAYASGLTQNSFAVTVTRGIVNALDKDELEAVLAHELTHIRNRDVRLLVVTVLFSGMLSFFAEMAWRSSYYSPAATGADHGTDSRKKGAGGIIVIAAIVLFVGYMVSLLFRFALSRRREYMADAGAVELTKNPQALIQALQKISGNAAMPHVPSGVQAMMIENPPSFFSLFATHPAIEDRIAVLRRLGGSPSAEHGDSIIPKAG